MTPLALQDVPLFSTLSAEDYQELEVSLQRRVISAGSVFWREGDRGDSFSIVLEGEIEIIKALGTADERLIRRQGIGSFVGEMSLFDREGRRTASVRAASEIELLVMTHKDFEVLLQRRPSLAYELVRVLSTRLRESDNATIRDLHEKNLQLAQAYEDLKAAQAQIIEKERLEQELRTAARIQQSMLPQVRPILAGYDFGTLMVPARAVGGDFYDYIVLGEGQLGLVVGDVSGKGMPAAIFMALTRSLLRAEAVRGGDPAQVLRSVNRLLLDMNDAGMFVTMLYGVLDGSSHQFAYARCGHELPLVVDHQGGTWLPTYTAGQPLGLFDEVEVDEQQVVVPPHGGLLLYTDGVTDAVNPRQEAFGLPRLRELVGLHSPGAAQEFCDGLLRAVTSYQGTAPQFDDFTLLFARRR